MLKSFVFLPAALLILSVPAVGQAQQSQPSPSAKPQAQQASGNPALDPNRKICRTEELIGSRSGGTRICKTAAQWEAERKQNAGTDQQ